MTAVDETDWATADRRAVWSALRKNPQPDLFEALKVRDDQENISQMIGMLADDNTIRMDVALAALKDRKDEIATAWIGRLGLYLNNATAQAMDILKERPGREAADKIVDIGFYQHEFTAAAFEAVVKRRDYSGAANYVSRVFSGEQVAGVGLVLSKTFSQAVTKPKAAPLLNAGVGIIDDMFGDAAKFADMAGKAGNIDRLSKVLDQAVVGKNLQVLPFSLREMRHKLVAYNAYVQEFSATIR